MADSSHRRSRNIFLALFLLASAGGGYDITHASGASVAEEVFSFDMWCLEMRLYPTQRCDAHRSDDVKAYEQYRAAVERYKEQRSNQEKANQRLRERLDRDSPNKSVPLNR